MKQHSTQPVPQGLYLPAVRQGRIIYTSGMTPRVDGTLRYSGKIETNKKVKKYRKAVRLATSNALMAAQSRLKKDERIARVLQLHLFLNAEQGFVKHAKVADYASVLLQEKLGTEGIGSRAAVGVATLPGNAPVEVTLVCVAKKLKQEK